MFAEIVSAIHASHRDGFRVIEFSVQDGHLHLITEAGSAPTREASTWLLRVGWRRLGRIQPSEVPAS